MSKLCVVVPTIRPEMHAKFVEAWRPLFEKHSAALITVWDGDAPQIEVDGNDGLPAQWLSPFDLPRFDGNSDLFCRRTDACRNLGFVLAAKLGADYVLTLDDDVVPPQNLDCLNSGRYKELFGEKLPAGFYESFNAPQDPIQSHLDVLGKSVPISWINTAHEGAEYLRGFPYHVRDEAPVMLSHGVWHGVPDFDGETQLRLESQGSLPPTLPYYVGPVPRGVYASVCGMNVMVKKAALPYFYFAPMGPDSGYPDLHRFADIWLGIFAKREFDRMGWAIYTGASTVLHTRASDAKRNMEQERLGREWNEWMWNDLWEIPHDAPSQMQEYCRSYADKRRRYCDLIRAIQAGGAQQ